MVRRRPSTMFGRVKGADAGVVKDVDGRSDFIGMVTAGSAS
jgi:hypothetical protein